MGADAWTGSSTGSRPSNEMRLTRSGRSPDLKLPGRRLIVLVIFAGRAEHKGSGRNRQACEPTEPRENDETPGQARRDDQLGSLTLRFSRGGT